jgi:hypothetical protein
MIRTALAFGAVLLLHAVSTLAARRAGGIEPPAREAG